MINGWGSELLQWHLCDGWFWSLIRLPPLSLLLCFSSLSSSAHLLMSTYWHFTIRSRLSRWSSPRRKSPLAVYGASAVSQEEMSEMFECMAMWAKCSIDACWFSMIFVYAHAGLFEYVDEVCLLCVEGQRPSGCMSSGLCLDKSSTNERASLSNTHSVL